MSTKPIILVEDNADDEFLTLRAFRKFNIANEILVVHDGVAAIELLHGANGLLTRTPPTPPQLVLLDLNLPRMDGIEVLRRIRADERTKFLPVVILTSSKEEVDVRNGYSVGANSFVRKPVEFGEFADAVGQLGLYWLMLNEGPPKGNRDLSR